MRRPNKKKSSSSVRKADARQSLRKAKTPPRRSAGASKTPRKAARGARARVFTPQQLAGIFSRQRTERKLEIARQKLSAALAGFRPKKGERGKIVFVRRDGTRPGRGFRGVGFGIYVDRNGKKHPIRQYDRQAKKLEKIPKPKKLSSLDVSRVRSKTAKKEYLRAITKTVGGGKTPAEKARYGFKKNFHRIDIESQFAGFAADEMFKILKDQKSTDRNFSLLIGVTCKTPNGLEWFETQIESLPGDIRKAKLSTISVDRLRAFFGLQVYGFIAKELSARGYVLSGSANYVKQLPENKGKRRDRWTKRGHEWKGYGKTEIEIKSVEWRFLQNTFEKL